MHKVIELVPRQNTAFEHFVGIAQNDNYLTILSWCCGAQYIDFGICSGCKNVYPAVKGKGGYPVSPSIPILACSNKAIFDWIVQWRPDLRDCELSISR